MLPRIESPDGENGLADDLDAPEGDAAAPEVRPMAGEGPPHDADWFTALVHEHERALYRYLVRRTGQEAADLTADVLTVAWRRRDDVPDGAELPWLYRTAGFVVANHRRKGRPIPVEHLPDEVEDDDPALHAVRDEQVREALAALSPRDRQIVLLNAWEGLTGQALAEVLGVSRGGADAALSRARARLAAAWVASD
ncbi:RNA polymerase sigma factor [Cellulomonas composti]|uniref:RNA polymerase sigma factor n=1 Tax=Cellulomonas composti TaxID=266130 RepID=UPI0027D99288|nr:sigma-70 family RNA polymerase sigma factor [Cellulomonas composti]